MKMYFILSVRFLLGLSLLLCFISCSESPEKIVKEKQSEFNRTLNNLNIIAGKISNQNISSDKISLPADVPAMDLDDIGEYSYGGAAGAQLFTVEDLLDQSEQTPVMHLFPSLFIWKNVKEMVKDGKYSKKKDESLKFLDGFSYWRYAVIIKSRTVRAPQIADQPVSTDVTDNATYSSGTYTSGEIEGDVLIYDLKDAGFLGGFPFKATSSGNIEATSYGNDDSKTAFQLELNRDFTEQIKKTVFYGILERLPQDKVYMNGNLRQKVITEKGR